MRDRRLSVDVRAESQSARDLLAEHVDELREALERNGVKVERFQLWTSRNGDPTFHGALAGGPHDGRFRHRNIPGRDGMVPAGGVAPDAELESDPAAVHRTAAQPVAALDGRLDLRI